MTNTYTIINPTTWPRRTHCQIFRNAIQPQYSVSPGFLYPCLRYGDRSEGQGQSHVRLGKISGEKQQTNDALLRPGSSFLRGRHPYRQTGGTAAELPGQAVPYQNDINWLNLIQDNIAACCSNYISYGFPNCIISFVFPVEERLKRITGLLHARGFEVIHILIDCEEEEMVRRIADRNTSRMISLEKARQLNRQMKALSADFRVDTTKINPDQVAVMVIDYINNILEMKKEISR